MLINFHLSAGNNFATLNTPSSGKKPPPVSAISQHKVNGEIYAAGLKEIKKKTLTPPLKHLAFVSMLNWSDISFCIFLCHLSIELKGALSRIFPLHRYIQTNQVTSTYCFFDQLSTLSLFYSWSFPQLILPSGTLSPSEAQTSELHMDLHTTWNGVNKNIQEDNSGFILPAIACLYKVLELCHHDRILCSFGSRAIPQRHFQSLLHPKQTFINCNWGTLLVPRYPFSLWAVIIFTYSQCTIAQIITRNEVNAGKICPPNKQIEIATVTLHTLQAEVD